MTTTNPLTDRSRWTTTAGIAALLETPWPDYPANMRAAIHAVYGRHSSECWAGPNWPVLVYRAWWAARRDGLARHARPEPLMLPASRRRCHLCGLRMTQPHAPWCPAR